MEYAEKLYLIPQNQMNKLRTTGARETIQQTVENDLDTAIRNVLQRSDLDSHGKAKLYSSVLQRFLTIVKQGDLENSTLTLSLPKTDAIHPDEPANTPATAPATAPVSASATGPVSASGGAPSHADDEGEDQLVNEILNNVPQRSLKNIKLILNKMSNAKQVSSWTNSGEFVYKGNVIVGSHMLDLVKSITAPHTSRDEYRPRGWDEFLDAFATLNIPFSTITNPQVKRTVETLKRKSPNPTKKDVRKKHKSKTMTQSTTDVGQLFNSPSLDTTAWLSF